MLLQTVQGASFANSKIKPKFRERIGLIMKSESTRISKIYPGMFLHYTVVPPGISCSLPGPPIDAYNQLNKV